MGAWKLYYDGTCNFCHASQLRVVRWAGRSGQPLDVELLQSPDAVAKGYGKDMVLEADGRVYHGGDAWLKALDIGPWYLRWLQVMSLTPPTRWLVWRIYRIVARVRHRLMGRRACPFDSLSS